MPDRWTSRRVRVRARAAGGEGSSEGDGAPPPPLPLPPPPASDAEAPAPVPVPAGEEMKVEFDPLDVMLERARRRNRIPLLAARLGALADRPALPTILPLAFLSGGDVVLLAAATGLGAPGFALGMFLGKATGGELRERVLPRGLIGATLAQLWPVGLGIVLDAYLS